ncbi:MAG TPA: sulfatase [Planctomycetota bacterium]|nr:sulfatase [Planctomycetota bacterium]
MKAIMVMFDSLNRRMLPPYGCNWVHAPNFARLASKSVTFDSSFVGSMPCMPARRELHTGRCNFLHRSWGPIEPFDDSMPEILKNNGVYTHLVTDHYHYWEDGGLTYHQRFSSCEFVRGQEGDLWKGDLTVKCPQSRNSRPMPWGRHDWVNRKYMANEEDHCQARTFAKGLEFMRTNGNCDNWFLQIETFDPHEPYFSYKKYHDLYPHSYNGPHWDWPDYRRVIEKPEEVEHLRCMNAALVSMCDNYLGKVIDLMDELDLWSDTMLIVNTDHGFLLGEHDWWAKCVQPFYNEVANTPLFIWDPRSGRRNERCGCLVQTIDLPATLLEYFGRPLPPDMQGVPLRETIAAGKPVRQAGLFGMHGAHVNVTNGRYVYMRAPVNPANEPLFNYTLMPTHMRGAFSLAELQTAELAQPFPFTKGLRTLKVKSGSWIKPHEFGTLLFDLQNDPDQQRPLNDPAAEKMMIEHLVRLMKENDAPPEQFQRLELT